MKIPPQIILAGRLKLRPSPLQPRQHFDDGYLNELGESIRSEVGFINALVVRAIEYRWSSMEITNGMRLECRCVRGEWRTVRHEEIPWDQVAGKGVKILLTDQDCEKARSLMAEYEIVAGECRWRSSEERPHPSRAGETMPAIADVPVVVREMDDVLVLETMLAENMQRGDLTELEECDAFHRAMGQTREDGSPVYATMVEFGEKIGVKEEVVRKRLSLRKLSKAARKLMEEGELSYSVARVICECPEPILDEIVACALDPVGHDVWLPGIGYPHDPLSAEETKLLIEEKFARKLQSAPFDLADEKLLPVCVGEGGQRIEGGSCHGCPWNSAPEAEVGSANSEGRSKKTRGRPRGEAKRCLNPSCFARKVECHTAAAIATAKEAGHEVLTGAEAEKLLRGSPAATLSYAYVDLDETIAPDDLAKGAAKGKAPKWKDVVFGEAETTAVVGRDTEGAAVVEKVKGDVAVPVTVVVSDRGHVHRLVERKVAVAAAAKTKSAVKLSLSAGRAPSIQQDDEKEKRKKEQAEVKLRNEVTFAVVAEVSEAVGAAGAGIGNLDLWNEFWKWMMEVALYHGGGDAVQFVAKRLGLHGDPAEVVNRHAKTLTTLGARRAFAVELLIARQVKYNGVGAEHFRPLCKLYKVDAAAIEKRIRAEKKAAKSEVGVRKSEVTKADLDLAALGGLSAELNRLREEGREDYEKTIAAVSKLPVTTADEPISPENYVYFAKLDEMKEAGVPITAVKVQSKFKLPGLRSAGLLIGMWVKRRAAAKAGVEMRKAAKVTRK